MDCDASSASCHILPSVCQCGCSYSIVGLRNRGALHIVAVSSVWVVVSACTISHCIFDGKSVAPTPQALSSIVPLQ